MNSSSRIIEEGEKKTPAILAFLQAMHNLKNTYHHLVCTVDFLLLFLSEKPHMFQPFMWERQLLQALDHFDDG